jgi:hypothetical protein
MKRRLPLWARIIIAVVAASLVGIVFGVARFVLIIREMSLDARDPVKQKAVLSHIGQFPNPLPDGFTIEKALHVYFPLDRDIVFLIRPVDKLMIQIWSGPESDLLSPTSPNTSALDAKTILERAEEVSGNGYPAKIQSVKSKGQTNIGGEQMAYIVGDFKDPQERKLNGMIGCICISKKEKPKTILIYALQPAENPYNQEASMNLLKSIKSF